MDAVAAADGLIVVSPIFSASYSGLFKSFFDVLDPAALDGKPVLIAATGGTERHSLVLDHALRPLFSYLHAVVVPTGVFAATSDWGSREWTAVGRAGSSGAGCSWCVGRAHAGDAGPRIRTPIRPRSRTCCSRRSGLTRAGTPAALKLARLSQCG